jgi:hypothetical protein
MEQEKATKKVVSKSIGMKDVTEKAKSELKSLTGFVASSVISAKKEGAVWKVLVELLEKPGIPDRMDILGIYETHFDELGELTFYERKGLRKRGDTGGQEFEEGAE